MGALDVCACGLCLARARRRPVAARGHCGTRLGARLDLRQSQRGRFLALARSARQNPQPEVVRAAVLLDRARFSPGAIDGIDGDNFRKAVGVYQKQKSLDGTGHLDQATWDKLVADSAPVLVRRKVTAAEAKGPFVRRISAKMEAQAKLARLSYT
ncbi:peptidoglycan-binding domain-containing protein [Lichenifustis flavocetrariae]|uniref:Peptidoglycan-binding protein n=1 Tax=Lichenifustis flavocetrariae TaxID=2949735 RepID=A0AA42CJW9_9HYPH|nr:peptidoglycan-binding domain-containing protein [Lichenifustis flavocetrariae]MCW6508551.1 peptidoglycan-binding protein [Lichenifustis flavocetrariae]